MGIELAEMFGRKVDLRTPSELSRYFGYEILEKRGWNIQFKDRIRKQHILDEAGEACKYSEGILFDEFVEDGKTVRAVIRSIGF